MFPVRYYYGPDFARPNLGRRSPKGHDGARQDALPELNPTRPGANPAQVGERGADTEAKDESGRTSLILAAKQRDGAEVVKLLVEGGADCQQARNNGKTPRDIALERGHQQIADFIAQHLESVSAQPPGPASVSAQPPSAPANFRCPITMEIFEDPVILVQTGQTYERVALLQALEQRPQVDPLTNATFEGEPQLIGNIALRGSIKEWRASNFA